MLGHITMDYMVAALAVATTWIAIPFTLSMVASEKGRSAFWAFVVGLLFPIPAVVYYIAVPSLKPPAPPFRRSGPRRLAAQRQAVAGATEG